MFRWEVFARDQWCCQKCGAKQTQKDRKGLPFTWEYGFIGKKWQIKAIKKFRLEDPNGDSPIDGFGEVDLDKEISNFGKPWAIRAKVHVTLHCHHNYYVEGKLPWEYPLEAMTTLCEVCHERLHGH